jgi:hypothetical protein
LFRKCREYVRRDDKFRSKSFDETFVAQLRLFRTKTMVPTGYRGSTDNPECSMCEAQDSVLYAVPVFTGDIDALRGEDIASEDEEHSINVCDRCLRFFARKRLLAFQLSGAARHSISFLEQRCGIKSAELEATHTHTSSPPSRCKASRTETETMTTVTGYYSEEREDFCSKGEGHVCPSEGGLEIDSNCTDMTLKEMRETLEELVNIVSQPQMTKPRSVSLENKHDLNTTSPTHECCPEEESADLTTPRSQRPRNESSLSRVESKVSLPGKPEWARSFSTSVKSLLSMASSGLRRKSTYAIDMTGVVFENGIPACWDLAKPCDHLPSSVVRTQSEQVPSSTSTSKPSKLKSQGLLHRLQRWKSI